jgi:5-methylcytosine-specific restriction endonuclease McrA
VGNVASLDASVLVLNRFYTAIRVVTVRRAFGLLCKSLAEVVCVEEGRFDTYDFDTWVEVSQLRDDWEVAGHDEWVSTVSFDVRVPRIIRLLQYGRYPVHRVKLNRRSIFARDENRCQYCGRKFRTTELSLDHVVPRSRGGESSWTNLVCACTRCNKRKGGHTPEEAGMKLIRRAVMPKRSPVIRLKLRSPKYWSWKQFLDEAYWSVELQ